MDILSFFHKLDKEGIKLVLKNGSLNIKSNFEIDPEILSEIKYNKTRIVEHLKNYQDEDTTDDILEKIISYDKEQLVQIPLSFSQERLWFVDQLQGSLEYHIPVVIRLEGALDVSVLEKSLQRIVSRHEVLRTNLLSKDGVGYQKIIAANNWSLDQIEVVDEDSIDYNLERYLITPFDLSSDYKLRSCLYNLGNDKYILTCVFHHIASDEWSGGILVREFTELYSALHSGRVPALPELSLQYSDYAIWQRKYLEGEVLESQLSYWENKLAGVSSLLLPTDYVRPSVQSSEGSSISFSLGQELSDSLQSLCQREGVTLFMVLISAFKVLLFRYSGQDDICVGTSIANRTQSELEGMIGFFVNMLALRSDLSGNPSFKELLGEVKNTTLEGYDHQLAPFEKVVDRVITTRDISMSPLFQVLFVLHNLEKESGESIIELDGVTLSAYESDNVISKFDIELHASESDSGIALNLEYCTALFNKATIDRMLEHYQKLLCSIVSDVKQPIGSLSMLTVKEEDELLNTFNNTFLEYPKDKTVVDLFKEQVGKTPEAIALVCELKKMTYKELDDKSNQLAHYLESQGVVRGSRVGVLFEKSLDIIISILGILKLGCTYVPLDPSLPSNRLSYILDDSSINFLLYSKESLLSSLLVSEFIFFINIEESYTYESSSVSYEITPNDLAYIMYTSGSTGVPKGVMVEHGNIVSLCTSCDYIPLNRDTVWLSTGSISFDATTLEFWGTLLHGGQLVLEDTNSLLDVITLKRLIIKHKVTTMWMTASWFHQVVEEDLSVFEPLCHLLVGGDVVLFNYTNKLKERYPELCLINGYGPTENTTFSTVYNIGKEANKNLPIGTPIKNSQVYITDSEMNLLPIGVVGELSVGGSGLSRGYLNESDLTREKFVSNPFIQGERMYKTGDLARWLPDGNLEFMGRIDDQVKIRGYRIELGEIESVLSSLDVVIQCCVLVKEDSLGEKCLIGYVVVEGDLDKTKIQEELKGSLSDYMVPRIWVELDAMPLTSNGKLDRKSLPEPNSLDFSTKEYVAPRNELEIKLAETWQELLGVEQIGIYDNFFELGGHSLLATRLVSMIRKELSIEIEIADIFEYSTISSLGSHVSVQSEGVFLPAIVIEDRPIRIPLSFSQERLWFLDQLEGTSSYHIPIVIQLEGRLAVSVLEKSLQSIVSRHEVLRTNILSAEGVGYQEVVKSEDWFLDHKYVSDQEGLDSILNTYLAEPFDLSKDYKLRACLYDLGNDNYVLACVFHHIASDGWSGDILIKEFTELYSAFQSGRAPVLPDLSLQYSDYAIWQRKYLEGEVLENQLSYWEDKLEGVSTLSLPTDYDRPVVQSSAGGSVSLELDKELSDSLDILCREEGVTLFMVLLSGFKVLLSRYSGQEDICVGTSIANRTQSDLEGMIGFFVNTLALRSELRGDLSFRELLEQVKTTTLGGYDHQLVPFEKVVDRVITTRDMSRSPLFQVLFSLQNWEDNGDQAIDLEGLELSLYESELNTKAQFDLLMSAKREASHISFHLVYRTSLYKKSSIINMLSHYKELLRDIVCNPGSRLGDLTLLRTIEKEELLVRSTGFFSAIPEVTIMDLFDSQVSKTPTAVALVYGDTELSYIDLYDRSNCLASHLQNHYHISTGDYVGVMQDRSDWSIISILGILKSGGVYVPIDVGYPSSRKSYIIDDTGLKVLLIKSDHLLEVIEFSLPIFTVDLELEALYKDGCFKDYSLSYDSEGLAYVIYTSGSTGDPKGVPIRHSSLTNYIINSSDSYIGGGISGSYMHLSMSFDASLTEIFTPLVNGKLLVISSTEGLDVFKDKNLRMYAPYDFIKLTPSHLELLSPVIEESPTELLSKRYVLGGESLLPIHLSVFRDLNISSDIINEYGPTESTVGCSTYVFNTLDDYSSMDSFPIGVPMRNMRLYILDDFNQLVPQGVIGELCIGGFGLSPGYLNKEELTKEKFIANPFIEGEKIYRTGDLSRWLPDGNIDFIGRKDNQVKIRGYRIELGEIESVLSSLVFINQCCVLAKEDVNGNKRLIGYVVVEGDLDKTKIQEELKGSLPDYMVPGIWVELDAMPLTSNGKLDRKSLPDPDTTELSSKEYVAARNEIELELVKIWQELLGVDRVGIYDNFFELGGHSLLATRLVSMIRKELNIEIEIADIFEYTTISSLGSHVSVQSEGVLLPSIVIEDRPIRIPLSFSQERLWFLDQLEGTSSYHIPIVIQLEGRLAVSVLEESLQSIVSRHEVLRTNILSAEGVGYQEVVKSEDWFLDHKYISDQVLLEESIQSYLMIPFDLSKDYKLRACLYDLGRDNYVLVCVFHHIASDGWSEGILVKEFTELYSAFQSGRVPVLPDLSLQYSDYAIWQRKYLEGEVLENQLSYWEDKLEGVSTLSLPTDYDRPVVQSSAGGSVSLELDKELSDSLNILCREEGVTLFMVLLSGFKVLLSRYSGQEDICVGTPIANRTQSELEGMIGFFVNTLALRSELGGDLSFRELLGQVKTTTLGGYDHQLVPFEKVVDRVITSRDMSRSPLFQVMFVLQNISDMYGESGVSIEDVTISGYDLERVTSQFDLTLNVSENDLGIILNIAYCTALFDKTTIIRMLNHYQELLKSIVTDITQSIGSLSMLSRQEETKLLEDFNATEVDYPKEKTIVDLFLEQVSKTPEAIAVVFEGEELSYKELDNRSNQLGHYLQDQGIEPDDLVGICLDRSLEMLIGILGILKSGGAYVPIDPEYPKDRIDYMLDDAGIRLVLSIETSVDVIANREDLSVFMLDRDWSVISDYPTNRPDSILCSSHLAYVIYTSGSTGKPKGVLITHSNVVRLFKHESCLYDFSSSDVWTLFHSFCFDFSVWEMYGALLHGGRLVIVPKEATKDAISFKQLLVKERVTVLNQTPSSFYVFQEEFLSEVLESSLRYVIFGGEALNPIYLRRWKESYPDCRLINMYGITETTVHVTYKEITVTDTLASTSVIGSAIPTLECHILDDHLNLVPIGVVGELCIGGSGVARGYLNRKELTRDKFIKNPFSKDSNASLYKSGDLGRWLADGTIEYIGRKDNQVKIRGYRIELGEIENVLSTISGIQSSCILAREDVRGNNRLIGYVVLEGVLEKEKIKEELRLSLPDYMIPQLWVKLEAMPLTSNGKLDRGALPDPDTTELSTKEYVEPRTDTELQLVEIWQELLGVDRVGIYDNFFELGGHSLLVVQLISRLQRKGFSIGVKDIFENPKIVFISDKLSSLSSVYSVPANGIEVSSIRITPSMVPLLDFKQSDLDKIVGSVIGGVSNIQDIYPLSPLQEGMYFHYLLSNKDQGDPYILPNLLSFPDIEKRNSFIEALQFVVNRHDILRTCIKSEGLPKAVQVVLRDAPLLVNRLDLDPSKEVLLQLESLTAPGCQSMDTSIAPLLDLKSADDPEKGCYYLIVNQHHLILDHVGLEKVIEEITTFLSGEGANLPEPVLYRDFIGHTLHSQSINDSESYFRSLLGGIEEPTYPFELSNVLGDGSNINESSVFLSKKLSKELRDVCIHLEMTPAVLFHAAYGLVVARCSNKDYAVFGSLFSGRLQGSLGAADSLGLFINTLPLMLNLEGSVNQYLDQVKIRLEELLSHEQTPLAHVQNWSGVSNDIALFSALLNYRHSSLSSEEKENSRDLSISTIKSYERTNYPFALSVDDYGVDFGLTAQIDGSISSDRVITYMEEALIQLLEGLNSKTIENVDVLGVLSKTEEIKLLQVFNDTSTNYSQQDKTLVHLFENQVKISPDAIAVVFQGNEMSYEELDKHSNHLANYLLSNFNVNNGDFVAVILDRNDWLIVSFLAILKTGAVYVPIDPNYPDERKEYIRKDSASSIVIDDSFLNLFKEDNSVSSNKALNIPIKNNDLAYVIYTSGSTGQPKGVMIEHKSIVNTILSQTSIFSISNRDNCLQFASPSFDASISEIFTSLFGGSRLCIIEEERKSDIAFFREFVINNSITIATLPPAFLQLLSVEDLEGIRTLITAGEAIALELAKKFSSHYNYINAYGPTETSICATTFNGNPEILVPIGKPIANTQIYILDDNQCLLPIDVVGELCVGGLGVARGYLNKEELTKDRFIENPFIQGGRLYKTGDLARWLPDGNLEFMGRSDDQVKIRGYRIELGEIENALSSLEVVNQCCVLAKEDVNGNKRLIGYVVVEGDLDKTKIQEELKGSLPDYMVPGIWVELDAMPLTSNGKLDRKSLPDPDSTELSTKEYVAPRNKIEKKIVAIWQDLLGIERIGVYDNFFELGGHSLLIAQLMSRLQLEGYHIGVKDIFDNPTIVSIVEKLSSVSSVYSVPENGISASSKFITPSMVPLVDFSQSDLDKVVSQVTGGISNIQDIYPLSPLQEGIHFHYLMSDSNQGDPYLLPSLFLFSDQAKRQNFIEALEFVIARHDVLRTCVLSSGLPSTVQVVLREAPLVVEKLILDKSKDVLSQLKLLIAPGNQWMDISKAPLLELKSADDPDNDCYYLILHEHHLILDHVGLEKIVEEVISYSSGDVTNLSAPVLYRNFIGHTLHAQSLNNGESYFRSLLGDIEEPTYPFGLSNVMGDGSDIDELRMFLPKKLGVTLRNASVRLGISPAVFFHAAYGMLIGRCSNKEYAVFGSLFSGRLQGSLGSANSLGLFINTLPVALELKGSVLEFLNQVKVGLEDLLPYEQTPLSHIQGWSGISNEKPLFSALLNYRHSPSLSESESTIDLGLKIIAGQERTNYPFTISVDDYGDDFELKAQVNKSIDASLIIDYLKESLTQLLEGLNDEKINVGNLDIISKKEKAKLLEVFNETSLAYPEDKTVIDLFEEQVIKTPKATAVIFEEKELSYIDLDKRSNQLANYLQNQGVQSGTLVGICLDRSLEVIIAILGILKSGGVYVPLDPEHPKRRTNYMIKDTGIDLVLSSDVNRTILDEHDGLTVLCLDKDWDIISGFSSIRLSNTLSPNDLAYIMYTSGSTGVPKGVMVEHGNIVSLCTSCDYIPLNRDTVWLSTGSISFDATTLEFWGTLLHGGQLVLEDTNSLLDVITLKRLIINHKVTTMWMTASWFHQVVEEDLSVFEPLCHLLVGGDVVLFNYTNKLKERYPELCLINGYGPTENTTFSTVYNIGKETNKNLPIGTPIKNSQVYITDSEMNLLPIGVVGELSVGGSGLSRGYLNESDLTREKFVSNPFIQGERMYKTGDLARWLPDGNLEFMGRIDDQVKIRGYRIELGEIESVLSSLDVVIQCCVLVKEDSLGEKCLVGYVVVEGDLDKEKIQNELKLGLSDYMVPRIWVELDAMPLTSNGKLDRKSLPDPDTTELSTKEYVAPRTQTELRLVAIWQELLGVEQIGIYDNFFELGGHSLLATRLVSMIRKEFEIEIIIKDVFEFVKIEELSTYLEHKKIKERESQNIIYKQIVKI